MAKRARFAWTLSESSDGDDDGATLGAADLDPGIEGDFEVPHEELSAEDCGRTCANYLIQLKDSGILRANHVCIIAYWASRAGAKMMEELSYPPGRQTGKYSRHYDGYGRITFERQRLLSSPSTGVESCRCHGVRV